LELLSVSLNVGEVEEDLQNVRLSLNEAESLLVDGGHVSILWGAQALSILINIVLSYNILSPTPALFYPPPRAHPSQGQGGRGRPSPWAQSSPQYTVGQPTCLNRIQELWGGIRILQSTLEF
jgi:hypothetical protein